MMTMMSVYSVEFYHDGGEGSVCSWISFVMPRLPNNLTDY